MPTVACRDLANTFTQANTFQATVTFNAAGGLANNILIGADSTYPTYGLLSFNGALTDAGFVGFAGGGGGGDLWVQAVANMHLRTGGNVEHLTLLSSGNIGIGTTSPAFPLHVSAAANCAIVEDAIGSSTSPNFQGRRAEGVVGALTGVLTNDNLATFSGTGYGATAYAGSRAYIKMNANENWTDSAQSTYMIFATTLLGTTGAAERMRIDNAGYVGIGTTTPAAVLNVVQPAYNGLSTNLCAFFDMYSGSSTQAIGANPLIVRGARGTPASPLPLQLNDFVGGFAARGYDGSVFSGGQGSLGFKAAENWSTAGHGTYCSIAVTPIGATTNFPALTIASTGYVGFGSTITSPQQLLHLPSTGSLAWDNGSGAADTSVSRGWSAGVVCAGNGTPGDYSGIFVANTIQAAQRLVFGGATAGISIISGTNLGIGNGAIGDASGSLTCATVNAQTGFQVNGSALAFSHLASHPTTISGYGITDAITTSNIGSQSVSYATSAGSAGYATYAA